MLNSKRIHLGKGSFSNSKKFHLIYLEKQYLEFGLWKYLELEEVLFSIHGEAILWVWGRNVKLKEGSLSILGEAMLRVWGRNVKLREDPFSKLGEAILWVWGREVKLKEVSLNILGKQCFEFGERMLNSKKIN